MVWFVSRRSRSEETVADAIQSSNGLAFVWEDNDLGFRAYLSESIVDDRASRQGIGKRLMPWHDGSA